MDQYTFNISDDEKSSINVNRQSAETLGYSKEAIDAAEQAAVEMLHKHKVRQYIAENAGDTDALLGTVTDGMQILLLEIGKFAARLTEAKDLAAVRAAAQPIAHLIAPLLDKINTGEVAMPFSVKGQGKVIEDIGTRATAVAEALTSLTPKSDNPG